MTAAVLYAFRCMLREDIPLNSGVLQPVEFDAAGISACIKTNRHINITLRVGKGNGSSRFWTCDLTHQYVTINAEYHT